MNDDEIRPISLWSLDDWDGGDGRFSTPSGMVTDDPEVAEAWRRSGTGRSAKGVGGVLIRDVAEIPRVREHRARMAALNKLTAKERKLLGLDEPAGPGPSGKDLLAKTLEAAFLRCADIIREKTPEIDAEVNPGDKTGSTHLLAMCVTAGPNAGTWPADKVSRWLGYVQGVLTARGVFDVDAERDLTREDFLAAYQMMGLEAPQTVDLSKEEITP